MDQQRLLTVREVAERLRSSPETVRRWLRQGKLRGFRPGGTKLGYRVPEEELERFLVHANSSKEGT
jgi:excisionase family DNA binding protein